MKDYSTPSITELGTVADFTRADKWDLAYDGALFHSKSKPGNPGGGGTPPSS